MSDFLDFLEAVGRDMKNCENRRVSRYEDPKTGLTISTCAVSDSSKPYETAVCHPDYGLSFIVVQTYDTVEEALVGHTDWIAIMTSEVLPDHLVEAGDNFATRMGDENLDNSWRVHPRRGKSRNIVVN